LCALSARTPSLITREGLLLAVDRLMAERWFPDDGRPKPALAKDQEMLQQALVSTTASLRALAVRSVGRFESPLDVPTISVLLQDADSSVRCEAANAMVMALHNSEGAEVIAGMRALMTPYVPPPPGSTPRQSPAPTGGGLAFIPGRGPALPVAMECTGGPAEALARLHYDRKTASDVLKVLVPSTHLNPAQAEAASSGFGRPVPLNTALLLLMLRRNPGLPVDADIRFVLGLKAHPSGDIRPDVNALEALALLQNGDQSIFRSAALWRCQPTPPGDPYCGWQVRYAGVKGLDPLDPATAQVLDRARRDVAPEVRMVSLRRYADAMNRTKTCEPIAGAAWDEAESTVVRIEAVDLLDPRCDERVDVGTRLAFVASGFGGNAWQLPAHALEALAKFDAAETTRIVHEIAMQHSVLFVRAAAARAAAVVKDEEALLTLARDADPNVRADALKGLAAIGSPAMTAVTLEGLESSDDQLVITAGQALKGTRDREAAAQAILKTLDRLTGEGRDTSRMARLVLLACLEAWTAPDPSGTSSISSIVAALTGLLHDFDPLVADKAAGIIGRVRGAKPPVYPERRALAQPTENALQPSALPDCARIALSTGGTVTIVLKKFEAPLTVARFAKLAHDRYFDGHPFIYRRRSLEVLVAGSPGANDFSGDVRFVRDEIGPARHGLGAVGLSTHGRDSGDMRFFVDLMPQPGFDYDYTVFGQMTGYSPLGPQFSPAPTINGILEGGAIESIALSYPPSRCSF
jgi:cyclophilin family peptidyl-prolyl cis-trans isomerase/HEAT repeat protein